MRRSSLHAAYYSRAESYSRSYNAEVAENDGKMPLTRAARVLGLPPAVVKHFNDGEWHHVGKYAARVNYYDVEAIRRSQIAGYYDYYAFTLEAWVAASKEKMPKRARAIFDPLFLRALAAAAIEDEIEAETEFERRWYRAGADNVWTE